MKKTLILLFYFLFLGQSVFAQQELGLIDSLIHYHQFDQAQRKTDSLIRQFDFLSDKKRYQTQLLELKYRQAYILDRRNGSPSEPLRILLGIDREINTSKLPELSYRVNILIALCYEKAENLDLTDQYLQKAFVIYDQYKLDEIYSMYLVRRGSYFRFLQQIDSVYHYAVQARKYAEKYDQLGDLQDSFILLSIVAHVRKQYHEAINYAFKLVDYRKKTNDTIGVGSAYNSIAKQYLEIKEPIKALSYSDSAYLVFKGKSSVLYSSSYPRVRFEVFDKLGQIDSAYHYLRIYQIEWQQERYEEEMLKSKELEEQYQSERKEVIIQTKNQQMLLIGSLLIVIIGGSIILFRKNRLINKQNQVIRTQLKELSKNLEQKKILLSELQHRVKNNLQHVISILEIQKESASFNQLDELIRSNQNRIHSMALLHRKLNVFDDVNDVNLERYITELAELVKYSYADQNRKVELKVSCEVEVISIEKALSIGLIIVELVSNSMKHAFIEKNIGVITVEITKNENTYCLFYADNGVGFDFRTMNEKGLGQEIIKGLIDQLNGKVVTSMENGFMLYVHFN